MPSSPDSRIYHAPDPPEFGTGKTIFVLAIVVGCFAMLWPRVFYPMFFPARMPIPTDVCCDLRFDGDFTPELYAQLCEKLVRRELLPDPGSRKPKPKTRKEGFNVEDSYAVTPELIDLCSERLLTLCGLDIRAAINSNQTSVKLRKEFNSELMGNITRCIDEYMQKEGARKILIANSTRRLLDRKPLFQERPAEGLPLQSMKKERGQPFEVKATETKSRSPMARPGPMGGARLGPGSARMPYASQKGGGFSGMLMPIYTIGIIVFFFYTIMKVAVWRSESQDSFDYVRDTARARASAERDSSFKGSARYDNGLSSSNGNGNRRKSKSEGEGKIAATMAKLLNDQGRKLVFTAIEGIVSGVEKISSHLTTDHNSHKKDTSRTEPETPPSDLNTTLPQQQELEPLVIENEPSHELLNGQIEIELNERSDEQVEEVVPQDESCLAVTGIETTADFNQGSSEIKEPEEGEDEEELDIPVAAEPIVPEVVRSPSRATPRQEGRITPSFIDVKTTPEPLGDVTNFVLDTRFNSDTTQLMVAESAQCCNLEPDIEYSASEDDFEPPMIITGKMVISLLPEMRRSHQRLNTAGVEGGASNRGGVAGGRPLTPIMLNGVEEKHGDFAKGMVVDLMSKENLLHPTTKTDGNLHIQKSGSSGRVGYDSDLDLSEIETDWESCMTE